MVNPPSAADDHCIGDRTLIRPSTARFSAIPISSPYSRTGVPGNEKARLYTIRI